MNKLIYFTIFLFSLSFNQEIWEKEIPPSSYLENLAITGESLHKNTLKYVSYGSVVLGIHLLNNWKEPHQELVSYLILITGLVGLVADKFILKNKSRTFPGKEFKKIKKYGPVSAGIQQLVSNFMMNRFKENNPQYGMTLYEKTLDNYLNQVPIDQN